MTGVSLSDPAPDTGMGTPPAGDGQGTPGSVTQNGTPPPSNNEPGNGNGSPGNSGGDAKWFSSFQDEALRNFAAGKNWSDPEAALRSHMELEKAFSSRTSTAPKSADEYKFDDLKLDDGIQVNEDLGKAFKGMAHKAGLSNEQANKLYQEYGQFIAADYQAHTAAQAEVMTTRVTEAVKGLETAFESKMGSEVFNRNVEMAKRAIRQLDTGLADELRNVGVITNVNGQDMVTNPKIFAALAKVGAELYSEDAMYGTPAENVNPFDPKTMDMQAQGWLIKNDPDKAKLLIRSLPKDQQGMWDAFLNK